MSLIVFIPLLSSICLGLYGFRLGTKGSALLTTVSLLIPWFLSCYHFYNFLNTLVPTYLPLVTWIKVGLVDVAWNIYLDALTASMFVLITTVSTLVYLYSLAYLSEDPHVIRFSSYISLFTFFMLILVSSNNVVQLFFGWEGVGICSYLLISFWYTRLQANKAAIQAVVVNKIGDVGVLLAMSSIFAVSKSFDFSVLFSVMPYVSSTSMWGNIEIATLPTITFLLFIGTVGKSAQLGLHVWLPSAMEGPTPVSALIHAATMVTAGIFLIVRCTPLFEDTNNILFIMASIGALTAFVAATIGLVQNDLKRVIAYSTCSQLGYMVLACGLSNYSIAFFHLLNHGCFKALLFLSAGSIIHGLADEQDLRKMGGLSIIMPITYCAFIVGSLALTGFPYLSGYYSKEFLLETSFSTYSNISTFAYLLGVLSSFGTAFYSARILYLAFWSSANSPLTNYMRLHEASNLIIIPLLILSLASLSVGYIGKDAFIGMGSPYWGNSIFIAPKHYTFIDAECLTWPIKLMPLVTSGLGALTALLIQTTLSSYTIKYTFLPNYKLYWFLNQKWYIEKMYNLYITGPILKFGYKTSLALLDKGFLELIGPQGITYNLTQAARLATYTQTGLPYHYTLVMFAGLYSFINLSLIQNYTTILYGLDTIMYYILSIFVILI